MDAVAIIVPVLNRPANVRPLMDSVAAATPEPHRLLFVAQHGDDAELAALTDADADFIVVGKDRRSWACKINDGFRASTEPWLLTAADDLAFHPEWFPRALVWATERTGVIGTNDLWNPRVMAGDHSTHSLVRRSYADEYGTIDQPGLVLHEGYPHQYADDELVQTAMARGVYVHAFDSIVEHLRPRAKAELDSTYRLGEQSHQQGKRLFGQRRHLWTNPAAPTTPVPPRAVVVTACYGGVDTVLHSQAAQDMPVDWVCFTDEANLTAPPPWRVVHAPAQFEHPNLAAKVHKATPTVDVTDVVWIDASMEVTSPSFVRQALAARRDGVAAFAHPRRDCIYDECEASLGAEGQDGKYASQPLREQVAAYRAEGHPEHGGLYACGTVAWDLADPRAVELGKAWLAECARWSWQDQLSFPVVCRRLGVTPGVFPLGQIEARLSKRGGYLANRWLRIWPHTAQEVSSGSQPGGVADRVALAQRRPAPSARDSAARSMETPGGASSERGEGGGVSVLIPYTSGCPHRDAAYRYVLAHYAQHHPGWEIIEGGCDGEWSKGRALADAVRQASHDVLVVADADSFIDPVVLAEAAALVASGTPWVMPHKKVHRLDEKHTAEVLAGGRPALARCHRPPYAGVVGGGITVLTREAWSTVGGVDPRFAGWGGEDIAFGWALETLCGSPVRLSAALAHLWHPPEVKGPHRRGLPASEALAGRYRAARGNPELMRELVADHAAVTVA